MEPTDPPLTAVRTFEAVARLGSASAAAAELQVSPSAVSHQIKLLEDFLRLQLTQRRGRSLSLTDAGREYFRAVRTAFTALRGATEQLREGHGSTEVRLSVIPLFASGWLYPRLQQFLDLHADIDLNISYANHRNYFSDAAALSVRFGSGQWRDYAATRIVSGRCASFCSPAFVQRHPDCGATAANVVNFSLIHDEERSGWKQWLADQQMPIQPRGGLLVEDGHLAAAAALDGLGIALLRPPLVHRHVREGRLVRLFEHEVHDGRDYYLCHRADQPLNDGEMRLRDWIIASARAAAA